MRATFAILFAALVVLSLATWWLQPPLTVDGKIRLVRVSDTNPLRQAQVDLFNEEYPKVRMEIDPGTELEKVIVQSMGGVGPDCFDSFDVKQLSAYVRSGIAWDVTDELKKRGIDLQRDCYPGILPSCVYGGRVYGVPTNIATDGVWYHKDMLAEVGFHGHKGPWKWNEFIPLAQKLTIRDKSGRPIRYGFIFEWWQWSDFFKGFDAHLFTPDGTRCIVDQAPAVAAVQLMYDLVYKYKVSSNPVEDASMATTGGFGSGSMTLLGGRHAAMGLGGRWWLATLRTFKGLHLGVLEQPYGTVRKTLAYGRGTLINKASPYREEALDYLAFQAHQPYNDLINDQADGISAFPKYNVGKRFLFNPQYPEEQDNATWRDIAAHAEAEEASPFVNGQRVLDIMTEQLDLVQANQKSPEEAMKSAAEEINVEIARTIAEDPKLASEYNKLTRGKR